MAFSNGNARDHGMAEINIIPLCDVLLVLLIIFMVTAPALSNQIDVDLPQPAEIERSEPVEPIALRIDASGQPYWNGIPVELSALPALMREESRHPPEVQPMLQIDASGDCDYQAVAKVLAVARNAGLAKIGFVRR